MAEENVKVAVRVRPFNSREKERNPELVLEMNGPVTTIRDPTGQHADKSFTFDHSYWSHSGFEELEDKSLKKIDSNYASQEDVFNDLGKGVLQNAYDGTSKSLQSNTNICPAFLCIGQDASCFLPYHPGMNNSL